jgi:nucleobase:cation symporter-1, NCS1 family
MKPAGLFWLWSGAVFNVEFFFYGTLIMTFGLSVGQAILAIVVGNLFYALLGWASLQGPETGTTAFMVSRAPFGQNGNRAVALFNWVTQVGFEVEGVYFVVATVILLFSHYGTALGTAAKIAVIVLAALVQLIMPLLGHATITRMLRYLAYLFIAFFIILAIFTFDRLHLSTFHQPAASWAVLLEILGVLAFTITRKTVGIAQLGVPQSFPSWFVVPFLIFAIIQLFAINTIDLYSSGVTLQALGAPIKRWGAVLVDTVVCAVITGIILFHGNFYKDFAGFLLYIVVWLAPWFGILMVDYLLRRGSYDPPSLAAGRGGLYWRHGGIHWPALIAQALGMVAALMWINAAFDFPSYVGPISNHFPGLTGSDFSWAIGIAVGGVAYYLLARRGVRREVAGPHRSLDLG